MIRLVLILHPIEMREIVFSPTWDSQVCFDEYTPPFYDFIEGEAIVASTITLSMLVGHNVGLLKWVLVAMPSTHPDLGIG